MIPWGVMRQYSKFYELQNKTYSHSGRASNVSKYVTSDFWNSKYLMPKFGCVLAWLHAITRAVVRGWPGWPPSTAPASERRWKLEKKNNRMMIMFSWMFSRYCYAQYLGLIICFLSCSLFSKVQSSLDHFEFLPWCYLGIYLLFYFENLFFFLLSKAKPICFKHSSDLFLILNIIAEECLKPTSDNFHRIHWNISFISSEI